MCGMKALLLENIHHLAETVFNTSGIEVEMRPGALGEDELIEALQGVDLLGIRSTTQVTRRVIEESAHLTAIGCFCIGTNQVALDEAVRKGIPVFNAPFSNTRSVVELTERDRELHAGIWNKSASGSHEIRGRKLGIVGYGNIGSQLSVVAEMLGMEVYFYDIQDRLALGLLGLLHLGGQGLGPLQDGGPLLGGRLLDRLRGGLLLGDHRLEHGRHQHGPVLRRHRRHAGCPFQFLFLRHR